jgi:hypothetical protein
MWYTTTDAVSSNDARRKKDKLGGLSNLRIAVIDGQGGGIGRALVEKIKEGIPKATVLALGTNSMATGQMLRAGADEGATGENAIVHNVSNVDIITGVIAVLNANSLMGELSPKMAEAIGASSAFKVLLPVNRCGIHVVSVAEAPLAVHIENAVSAIRKLSSP